MGSYAGNRTKRAGLLHTVSFYYVAVIVRVIKRRLLINQNLYFMNYPDEPE